MSVAEWSPVLTVADEILRLRCAPLRMTRKPSVNVVTVSVAERSPVLTVADEILRLRCAPLRKTNKKDVWKDNKRHPEYKYNIERQ